MGRCAEPKRGLKCTSKRTFEDRELEANLFLKNGASNDKALKKGLTFLDSMYKFIRETVSLLSGTNYLLGDLVEFFLIFLLENVARPRTGVF